MKSYLKGLLKNIFNKNINKLSLINEGSVVSPNARIKRFCKLVDSRIDSYSYLDSSSTLLYASVGKFCSIGSNTQIGIPEHSLRYLSTSPVFTEAANHSIGSFTTENLFNPFKEVKIGNDVWIGREVIIKGGVEIGDGAVIGAKSLVTKNVEPYSIVAGIPAKVIRMRFSQEVVDFLVKNKWWELEVDKLVLNIKIFQKEDLSIEDLRKIFNKK